MREAIRNELLEIAENDYKKFSSALMPGVDNMLGVRLPVLRKMAGEIAKSDWRQELTFSEDIYFEETMLRGMVIGSARMELDELLAYITGFVPLINNWSVCDSFCSGLKLVRKNRNEVWEYLERFLCSEKEFEVRVGLIILLDHYVKCDSEGRKISRKRIVTTEDMISEDESCGQYTERILSVLNRRYEQGYYAQMAAAWTMAEMFCTFPASTMRVLENSSMDDFTYRKTIQKICESKTPSAEVKSLLRFSLTKSSAMI